MLCKCAEPFLTFFWFCFTLACTWFVQMWDRSVFVAGIKAALMYLLFVTTDSSVIVKQGECLIFFQVAKHAGNWISFARFLCIRSICLLRIVFMCVWVLPQVVDKVHSGPSCSGDYKVCPKVKNLNPLIIIKNYSVMFRERNWKCYCGQRKFK